MRRTTDLQILAFITGSIARRTSAIQTWVRKGFSARTSLSMTILPSVLDFGGSYSDVFTGWIGSFSFLARIVGSYFHSLKRMKLSFASRLSQFCAIGLSSSSSSSMYSFFSRSSSSTIKVFLCSLNRLSLLYIFCCTSALCQQSICFLMSSISLLLIVFMLDSASSCCISSSKSSQYSQILVSISGVQQYNPLDVQADGVLLQLFEVALVVSVNQLGMLFVRLVVSLKQAQSSIHYYQYGSNTYLQF